MFEHTHTFTVSIKGNGAELQVKIVPPFLNPHLCGCAAKKQFPISPPTGCFPDWTQMKQCYLIGDELFSPFILPYSFWLIGYLG